MRKKRRTEQRCNTAPAPSHWGSGGGPSMSSIGTGNVGKSSISDKVLLYCYDFDPVGKKYALRALNVIKLGGAVTLILIVIFMFFMWFKKNKNNEGETK